VTIVIRISQALVNKPLQTVFDYVSDLTKHPEWSGGELKIEAVTSDPIAVGKEYRSKGAVATEKDRPNTVTITELEPPHKFGFVSKDPDFGNVFHLFTFKEEDDGVLVKRTTTLTLKPLVAFAFRFFIYPLIGNPAMQKSFQNLKTKMEE